MKYRTRPSTQKNWVSLSCHHKHSKTMLPFTGSRNPQLGRKIHESDMNVEFASELPVCGSFEYCQYPEMARGGLCGWLVCWKGGDGLCQQAAVPDIWRCRPLMPWTHCWQENSSAFRDGIAALWTNFAAFLWFLLSDRQECGKTGNSSAPKMHRRGEKSKISSEFRKYNPSIKRHAVRRCSRK